MDQPALENTPQAPPQPTAPPQQAQQAQQPARKAAPPPPPPAAEPKRGESRPSGPRRPRFDIEEDERRPMFRRPGRR
jgi:hypothetical protein